MSNDNRNMILAIVLSAFVLLGWNFVAELYFPAPRQPAAEKPLPTATSVSGTAKPHSVTPAAIGPAAIRDREIVLKETPRVTIDTPRLQGSINLKGARIDDLVLITQRATIAKDSPPIRLLAPGGAADAYFASFGWTGEAVTVPGPDTLWTASGYRLTPDHPITLAWDNPQGQRFLIRFSVDEGYMFTALQSVVNGGAGAVAIRPWTLISRASPSKDISSWTNHVGPVGVFNNAANYDWSYQKIIEKGDQNFKSGGGWLGFTDKYWLTAIIPDQQSSIDAAFRRGPNGGFQADFAAPAILIAPGKTSSSTARLFAGAKEVKLLDRYQNQLGIAKLDKAIDWGWFEWFMKPIFALLNWLFHAIGNFGIAIICLTLIVRALMFPIAQKQFKSMAGMRVVQPKMKALQERYKDDKARLQQEMLRLYQEEKVNPLAGCLPILIQIPIFYALYKVLMLAVEMRHQPFVLWIKDLSAPDPLTPVNLFGYLAFTPPAFLALGILPILLGITMWLQFRLNPAPVDPVQQQIFGIMPWVMMFIMAPFAAGLQLYWVTNNLLTIAQQKWLYSRHPGMKEPVAR